MSKTIFITGSSRGIGASIAKLAKAEGYQVIIHGRSLSKSLINLSKKLKCKYLVFDVNDKLAIKENFKKIKKINTLVNCAGINISKSFDGLSPSDWKEVYNTNVFGVVNVTNEIIPLMRKSTKLGKIINISSIKAIPSTVGRLAYASSKASIITLTAGLAKELAPNIIVNCVSPGFTKTEMTKKTWSRRISRQVDSILLKRMAKPEEIANLIMFLSSEKSNYINGQNIIIDGGFSIRDV